MSKTDRKRQFSRLAPTYRRLSDAPYAALDELEKVRHDLHVDIDAIMDAIPYAELDARCVGFRSGRGYDSVSARSSSVLCDVCRGTTSDGTCQACSGAGRVPTTSEYSDPTSSMVLGGLDRTAADWLASARSLYRDTTGLANRARVFFGFDPQHGKPEGDRPQQKQERRSEVEMCAFCNEPAPAGRDEQGKSLLRRVDEIPVHASPCYWTLAKQALRAGVSPASQLQSVVAARGVSNVSTQRNRR